MTFTLPPPTSDAPVGEIDTLADLLELLGGVPLDRVLFRPPPGLATESDAAALAGRANKRLCELIHGTLVEKAMGVREARLALYLGGILDAYILALNLGYLLGADGMIRLWPGRIRVPDLGYFPWDSLPGGALPDQPVPRMVPALAVEVLSVSNTTGEMLLKRQDYFTAGCRLVWEIDPRDRVVRVYNAAETFTTLTAADRLTGGDELPAFAVPVADLFADLDRRRS